MCLIQGARDMLTQSSILFGIRNSKLMRTKNVSEVKKDMLSLVHILAKCLPKMLCVITESRYARGQTLRMFQILFDWRLTFEAKVIWFSFIFKTASGVRGAEKSAGSACWTTVEVMITLLLCQLLSHTITQHWTTASESCSFASPTVGRWSF